jgi:hypothetical protein
MQNPVNLAGFFIDVKSKKIAVITSCVSQAKRHVTL